MSGALLQCFSTCSHAYESCGKVAKTQVPSYHSRDSDSSRLGPENFFFSFSFFLKQYNSAHSAHTRDYIFSNIL